MAPPPDDLAPRVAEALARLRASATVDIATASVLLGRSRNRLYEDARRTGKIADIDVIRLGSGKTVRVPARALARLLQIEPDA